MKKFTILGISLSDLTAREGLKMTDHFLHSGALNTVTYLTSQALIQAAQEEHMKKLLEETDLTLCVEPDILEAAGIAGAGRVREIEERIFLREFLKRIARQQESIFILGDSAEQAEHLLDMLVSQQDRLNVIGCCGYDEFDNQKERLMNVLNEAAPRVIFSRMTWPVDLELMHEGRRLLNAELWVALPEKKFPGEKKRHIFDTFWKKLFQKKVNEYNQEKNGS